MTSIAVDRTKSSKAGTSQVVLAEVNPSINDVSDSADDAGMAIIDFDNAEPKWPIRSPPTSEEDSDETTGSPDTDDENIVLDVDKGAVTFSTS